MQATISNLHKVKENKTKQKISEWLLHSRKNSAIKLNLIFKYPGLQCKM